MPRKDGFQVLAALRDGGRTRGMPVVLLTARRQELDILRGFELGAADYVVKPFNPLELAARLRRLAPVE
jgi:DNA-binding response OmpR family regulator